MLGGGSIGLLACLSLRGVSMFSRMFLCMTLGFVVVVAAACWVTGSQGFHSFRDF